MSEQQQPEEIRARIKGYRQLSEDEQQIINDLKSLAELVGVRVEDVLRGGPEGDPWGFQPDVRWARIAQTHLQQGFMALIRSIAKPTTF